MLYLDASALVKRYVEGDGSRRRFGGRAESRKEGRKGRAAGDQGLATLPTALG
jgi:hypothetical protein